MIEINIQMPEKCGLCPCFHHENPIYCQVVKADRNKKIVAPYGASRPEWCPLKKQEPVEPVLTEPIMFGTNRKCSNCDKYLFPAGKFCPHCGKAVKWND